ncbi:MAG: hypothetical protein K6A40_01185 [Solobacterium sp.]|nr:hypothetical protein [Solobacterium sp.]
MQILTAAVIIAALAGVNVWLYSANRKTPVPEGCENLKPDCASCGITNCAMRNQFLKENDNGNR